MKKHVKASLWEKILPHMEMCNILRLDTAETSALRVNIWMIHILGTVWQQQNDFCLWTTNNMLCCFQLNTHIYNCGSLLVVLYRVSIRQWVVFSMCSHMDPGRLYAAYTWLNSYKLFIVIGSNKTKKCSSFLVIQSWKTSRFLSLENHCKEYESDQKCSHIRGMVITCENMFYVFKNIALVIVTARYGRKHDKFHTWHV